MAIPDLWGTWLDVVVRMYGERAMLERCAAEWRALAWELDWRIQA